MADLKAYLEKRGVTDADMEDARRLTREKIEVSAPYPPAPREAPGDCVRDRSRTQSPGS